jgi:hypothetical protein
VKVQASRLGLAFGAGLLNACAGGTPLLHPAHTLPENKVSFAAGTSGHFALGELKRAGDRLDRAASLPGGATTREQRRGFIEGALTRLAVAPGVAPFVAGRVGLGGHNEAGVTYTGRAFRLDGRHAFEWTSLAFSVGLAATGALARPGDQPFRDVKEDPSADAGLRTLELTSVRGYGLELPLLFGYRSDADVVKAWLGLRTGFERDTANVAIVVAPDTPSSSTAYATRLWGGGLVGFSVGLAPIEVRVEVDGAYQTIHGSLMTGGGEASGDVAGWSLTPAMAISAKF